MSSRNIPHIGDTNMAKGSSSETTSKSSSTSYTGNVSNSSSNSSSYTEGGSHSETSSYGGSHSVTQGLYGSKSESQGGSESDTAGKSWSSGTVDATTLANKSKYSQDYQQSQQVQDTYNRLQDTLNSKPGVFQSSYTDQLNNLYQQIMNRDPFSYNFNADPMYQMYAQQYKQQGKNAMQDTMGQAAALTGGYSSSYAQTAGQQAYQNYLQELNNMIPELREQAYQEWQTEGQDLYDKYNLTNTAYNNEYNQYRDTVSDWKDDRTFAQNDYQNERSFDYNQYSDNRNYWNTEYWNQRNAEQSNKSNTGTTNWDTSETNGWNYSETDSSWWEHSTTDTTSWSNTVGHTNTNSASIGMTDTSGVNWSLTNTNPTGSTSTISNAGKTAKTKDVTSGSQTSLNALKSTNSNNGTATINDYAVNMAETQLSKLSSDNARLKKIDNWLQNGFNGAKFTEADAKLIIHELGLDDSKKYLDK